jgi:hypothetical protein
MKTLQKRLTRTSLHVLRIVIFVLLPTIVVIESVNTLIRSMIQFIRNQIDEGEEEKNIWFPLSTGLGMYALMPITSKTTKKDDVYKISLLKLNAILAERERVGWSWA